MKLIRHFQELAFEKQLNFDCARNQRERRQFNGDEDMTIGLLYHFTDKETDKQVNEFVSELKDKNCKVTVLGYFDSNSLPDYYTQKLEWDIIIPKNVTWFNKPIAPFVKLFSKQEFDLLIDLTMEDVDPLLYAGALSRAHFKTGRYSERTMKFYDLMIHTEHIETLPEFIQQVKHYISKINC